MIIILISYMASAMHDINSMLRITGDVRGQLAAVYGAVENKLSLVINFSVTANKVGVIVK